MSLMLLMGSGSPWASTAMAFSALATSFRPSSETGVVGAASTSSVVEKLCRRVRSKS